MHRSPYFCIFVDSQMEILMRMLCALALSLLAISTTLSQHAERIPADTLALVGTKAITARDLIERLELMPWPGKDKAGQHDSAKVRALQSLVAEHLLAMDANARNIDLDSNAQLRRDALEHMLVRDALYRKQVLGKDRITTPELRQGIQRYGRKIVALFLRTRGRAAAQELARQLQSPARGDTALRTIPPGLVWEGDTLTVTFGSADPAVEDTAYTLSSQRPLSGPLRSSFLGWGILYYITQYPNPDFMKASLPDRQTAVVKMIRSRKEDDRAAAYTHKVLGPQRAEANPLMFEKLAGVLHERVVSDSSARRVKNGFRIIGGDLEEVGRSLESSENTTVISVPSGDIPLRTLLAYMGSREMVFSSLDTAQFKNELNALIKDVVRAELLTREGLRQGLQYSAPVTHDLNTWTDYWRASKVVGEIEGETTISDQEVNDYLIRHADLLGDVYEVSIREILSDSIRTSYLLLDSIARGADMAGLAKRHSRRNGWAQRGGESGFFPVSAAPDLGIPALFLDSGAVAGPLHVRAGFSIIMLLGKKKNGDGPAIDSLRLIARSAATAERGLRAVNEHVARLASQAKVKLYYDRLARVNISPANMVTKRFMGFGGVMIAVPTLRPIYQWIKDAQGVETVLP
jgi:hypothetical protein